MQQYQLQLLACKLQAFRQGDFQCFEIIFLRWHPTGGNFDTFGNELVIFQRQKKLSIHGKLNQIAILPGHITFEPRYYSINLLAIANFLNGSILQLKETHRLLSINIQSFVLVANFFHALKRGKWVDHVQMYFLTVDFFEKF